MIILGQQINVSSLSYCMQLGFQGCGACEICHIQPVSGAAAGGVATRITPVRTGLRSQKFPPMSSSLPSCPPSPHLGVSDCACSQWTPPTKPGSCGNSLVLSPPPTVGTFLPSPSPHALSLLPRSGAQRPLETESPSRDKRAQEEEERISVSFRSTA